MGAHISSPPFHALLMIQNDHCFRTLESQSLKLVLGALEAAHQAGSDGHVASAADQAHFSSVPGVVSPVREPVSITFPPSWFSSRSSPEES